MDGTFGVAARPLSLSLQLFRRLACVYWGSDVSSVWCEWVHLRSFPKVVPEVTRSEGRVDILSPTEQHRSSIQLLNISTKQYGVLCIPNFSFLQSLAKTSGVFFFRDRLDENISRTVSFSVDNVLGIGTLLSPRSDTKNRIPQ